MKNLLKLCLVFLFLSTGFTTYAQKFGHIDTQQLIQIMPGRAEATAELEKVAKELEGIQGELQKEYQAKLTEYLNTRDSLSDVAQKAKEGELQSMQQRIESSMQVAQQQMQQKQAELFKPILDKAKETIEAVAKEQGLIYVFDVQPGTPILYKSNDSVDILPLAKKKLGIQ
ncbi:OmpH family outer membrane protein [Puteibacter caeruleilacunae]|nr:OmpH family outer membrane protein [Puteibacter caeruleilacunae]